MSSWLARPRLWLWGAARFARLRRPDVAFGFLGGLGDELLCSAPLVEWERRGARNLWLMSSHPEFFQGLSARAHILPNDPRYPHLAAKLGRDFRFLSYSTYEPATDRDPPPPRHLIAEMCRRAGLTGPVRLRPHLKLEPAELAAATEWRDCVAIHTSTLNALVPMPNKQWPVARFQTVVDRLSPSLRFVQIGSPGDPLLRGVNDQRGRTTLRQTAAILHHTRAQLGLVGFLMHLARAVECPSVIIYGGRETPELSGYPCNVNLTRRPACSPCWQRARCDHDRMCLTDISADEVVVALETILARPRAPLAEAACSV